MKVTFVLALLTGAVAAQNAAIRAPPASSTFTPSQNFTVEVDRPNSLTNSREVSVAIGLLSCVGQALPDTCEDVDSSQEFGDILYAGPYTPVFVPETGSLAQNFTVQVPGGFQSGAAVLSVAHFTLVGARFFPWLEVLNETVFIR